MYFNMWKMRPSTRFLLLIPIKFLAILALGFFTWFGLFSYLELKSGVTSEIHAELPFFSFIMALTVAVNCLISMCAEYYMKRRSEQAIEKYLARYGVSPIF